MTEVLYQVGGQALTADELKRISSPAKKRAPKAQAPLGIEAPEHERFASLGFLVEGYPPEHVERAQKLREMEIEAHPRAVEEARADGRKVPLKPPPFTHEEFVTTHKPTRAAKPFQIESAAEQLAEMCRRAGWFGVAVRELRRAR